MHIHYSIIRPHKNKTNNRKHHKNVLQYLYIKKKEFNNSLGGKPRTRFQHRYSDKNIPIIWLLSVYTHILLSQVLDSFQVSQSSCRLVLVNMLWDIMMFCSLWEYKTHGTPASFINVSSKNEILANTKVLSDKKNTTTLKAVCSVRLQ